MYSIEASICNFIWRFEVVLLELQHRNKEYKKLNQIYNRIDNDFFKKPENIEIYRDMLEKYNIINLKYEHTFLLNDKSLDFVFIDSIRGVTIYKPITVSTTNLKKTLESIKNSAMRKENLLVTELNVLLDKLKSIQLKIKLISIQIKKIKLEINLSSENLKNNYTLTYQEKQQNKDIENINGNYTFKDENLTENYLENMEDEAKKIMEITYLNYTIEYKKLYMELIENNEKLKNTTVSINNLMTLIQKLIFFNKDFFETIELYKENYSNSTKKILKLLPMIFKYDPNRQLGAVLNEINHRINLAESLSMDFLKNYDPDSEMMKKLINKTQRFIEQYRKTVGHKKSENFQSQLIDSKIYIWNFGTTSLENPISCTMSEELHNTFEIYIQMVNLLKLEVIENQRTLRLKNV